jgi:hypothetical protein
MLFKKVNQLFIHDRIGLVIIQKGEVLAIMKGYSHQGMFTYYPTFDEGPQYNGLVDV